jgi:hypothetical protein
MFVFSMRRIYTQNKTNEHSGLGLVSRLRFLLVPLVMAVPATACTTVALYEPVSADITLIADVSPLHAPSEEFCRQTREKGLATGEASLASLADMLSGKDGGQGAYWRIIGADKGAPAPVVTRIRNDMKAAATGIDALSRLAETLMKGDEPTSTDVLEFERALIHARQARDSLSDAFVQVNKRSESEYQISLELTPLDEALSRARRVADELAATKVADPVATSR